MNHTSIIGNHHIIHVSNWNVTHFRRKTDCLWSKVLRGAGHWQSLLGEVDLHQQIAGQRGVGIGGDQKNKDGEQIHRDFHKWENPNSWMVENGQCFVELSPFDVGKAQKKNIEVSYVMWVPH